MNQEKISKTEKNKADNHDTTMPLLAAMYFEFKELSKKTPSAAISKQKITIVNRLLSSLSEILADEESIKFLDVLDEDDVPQMSDVTLMLSQYVAAMKAFEGKYYGWDGLTHKWFLK